MSSNITSNQSCFDFGEGETNDSDDGNATMNAIYYGTDCWTGNCTGPGPWVGADIENGTRPRRSAWCHTEIEVPA